MALEVNSVPLSLVPDLIRDHLGLAAAGHERLELARYPQSAERCVGNQCQALPGAVIDHGQNPEAPAIGHLIGDEVGRPALVGGHGDQHRRDCQDFRVWAGIMGK